MSKRIRYGILGCGHFAEKAIAPAIRSSPNSELLAIQKRSPEAARAKAAELAVPLAFGSVGELVARSDIDAVFVVSANSNHCPDTLAAARAGKHVIVEKPMAMNAAEARNMIDACHSNGVKLSVGHMTRLSPLVQRIRELVRSGSLGTILFARADFVFDTRSAQRTWLYDRNIAGGGPVFDVGVHCIDTLRFVIDDEPTDVRSLLVPPPSASHTEILAHIALRFSRGTVGSVSCSFRAPVRKRLLEVTGTEGSLSAPDFTLGGEKVPLSFLRGDGDRVLETRVEEIDVPNLYVEEITHFSDCILGDLEPVLSGENGLRNQLVIDAALKE